MAEQIAEIPYPITGFTNIIKERFFDYLRTHPCRLRFTAEKLERFQYILSHPDAPAPQYLVDKKDQADYSRHKKNALERYFMRNNKLFIKRIDPAGLQHHGFEVVLDDKVFDIIANTHDRLHHPRVYITYHHIADHYHYITRDEVDRVLSRCSHCLLRAPNHTRAPLQPIESNEPLD